MIKLFYLSCKYHYDLLYLMKNNKLQLAVKITLNLSLNKRILQFLKMIMMQLKECNIKIQMWFLELVIGDLETTNKYLKFSAGKILQSVSHPG